MRHQAALTHGKRTGSLQRIFLSTHTILTLTQTLVVRYGNLLFSSKDERSPVYFHNGQNRQYSK